MYSTSFTEEFVFFYHYYLHLLINIFTIKIFVLNYIFLYYIIKPFPLNRI